MKNAMKDSIKLITVLMMFVISLSIAGCRNSKVNIEELKQHKGPMLVITSMSAGEGTVEEFEDSIYEISISYDGRAHIPNPIDDYEPMMSDEDFTKLYKFCVDAVEKDKFADYKEDVSDGTVYTFTFYDLEGVSHEIYSGYCYSNKDLQDAIATITDYTID